MKEEQKGFVYLSGPNNKKVLTTRTYILKSFVKRKLILFPFIIMGKIFLRAKKTNIDHSKIKKILIMRAAGGSMGDTIFSLGVIPNIRAAYPKAHITYLTRKEIYNLVKENPYLDKVEIYSKEEKVTNPIKRQLLFKSLSRELKKENYDLVVHIDPNLRFYIATYFAKIPFSAGFDMDGRGFLLTNKAPIPLPHKREKHEAKYYLDIVRSLGLNVKQEQKNLKVYTKKGDSKYVKNFLKENKIKSSDILIGMQTGGKEIQRSWSTEGYAKLIDLLYGQKKAKVILFGDKNDLPKINKIKSLTKNKPLVIVDASILEVVEVLKKLNLFVGNDSGLSILSGATNVPTVVIYGPGNPDKWSPYPFGSDKFVAVRKDIWCSPCHNIAYEYTKYKEQGICVRGRLYCQEAIELNDIYKAALSLLK